jgi:hypothetical protein
MKKIFAIKYIVLFLTVLLSLGSVKAQDSKYSVALDTSKIIIGDQINLTFKAIIPRDVKIEFPVFRDTLVKGIEILDVGEIRTKLLKNNLKEHIIEYKITAFDTGVYIIPAFPLRILSKGFDKVVRTDAIQLRVTTFKVDTSKEYADVVAPKDTPVNFAEIMPYLLWAALAVLLISISYFIIKKWRAKESIFSIIEKPKEPAHIVAFRNLDKIKNDKIWESGKIKDFHTQLTEVVRIYIEDQFGILAMEQTSVEIIEDVRKEPIFNERLLEMLQEILYRADFVKFAKAIPLGHENQQSLDYAYQIVNLSYKEVLALEEAEKRNQEVNLD